MDIEIEDSPPSSAEFFHRQLLTLAPDAQIEDYPHSQGPTSHAMSGDIEDFSDHEKTPVKMKSTNQMSISFEENPCCSFISAAQLHYNGDSSQVIDVSPNKSTKSPSAMGNLEEALDEFSPFPSPEPQWEAIEDDKRSGESEGSPVFPTETRLQESRPHQSVVERPIINDEVAKRKRKPIKGGLVEEAKRAIGSYKADKLLKCTTKEKSAKTRSLHLQVQAAVTMFGQHQVKCREIDGSRQFFVLFNDRCLKGCNDGLFSEGRKITIQYPFKKLECPEKCEYPVILFPELVHFETD